MQISSAFRHIPVDMTNLRDVLHRWTRFPCKKSFPFQAADLRPKRNVLFPSLKHSAIHRMKMNVEAFVVYFFKHQSVKNSRINSFANWSVKLSYRARSDRPD